MIPDLELITIFTLASMRRYFDSQEWGMPVTYLQQESLGNVERKNEVQIQTMFEFPQRGDRLEIYGLVTVRASVKTEIVQSDVYYHVRAKARVTQILSRTMPLFRIGGTDIRIYDQSQWGILRRLPTNTIKVMPNSIDVPNSTVVQGIYEIQQTRS